MVWFFGTSVMGSKDGKKTKSAVEKAANHRDRGESLRKQVRGWMELRG